MSAAKVPCPGCQTNLVMPKAPPTRLKCPQCATRFLVTADGRVVRRPGPSGASGPAAGRWLVPSLVAALVAAVLTVGILLGRSFFREAETPSRHASGKPPASAAPADKNSLPEKDPARPPEPAKSAPSLALEPPAPAPQPAVLLDEKPRLTLRFHDSDDPAGGNSAMYPTEASMRFGLSVVGTGKPLTPRQDGRSNNTCLRIDGTERLFGLASSQYQTLKPEVKAQLRDWPGRWVERKKPLGKGRSGRERLGFASVWRWDGPAVQVTQTVELVPGPQSRVLDTCLVRYLIENLDPKAAHVVGLRFLLDTQIGANDGVPFLIPGETALCETMKDFADAHEVPGYVQACERGDLANPGTVALVRFRLGGRVEPPARVTLGVWPGYPLQQLSLKVALDGWTLWDVPVLPLKTPLSLKIPAGYQWWPDSAVTLYWKEQPLPPGGKRIVGFTYGLGGVAADQSKGQLGLVADGPFTPGSALTVTALVQDPRPGEVVTLTLPEGFELTAGAMRQAVPPLPPGAAGKVSPVAWKVRAGKEGPYLFRAARSSGAEQSCPITIRNFVLYDPLEADDTADPKGLRR